LLQQAQEVTVLGHNHGPGLAGGLEDDGISGIPIPEPLERIRINTKLLCDPGRKRSGKLRIDPEDHAASTG
jgi:hypothetical protein